MNRNEEDILKISHQTILEIAEHIKPTIEQPMVISSQELALNLKILLQGKGPLLAQDAESYRELIIGLNEKLKVLQIALERIDVLSMLNIKLALENDLREKLQQEAFQKLQDIQKLQDEKYILLEKEKNQALNELIFVKNQLENSKLCEDELKIEVDMLKGELESYKNQIKNYNNFHLNNFNKDINGDEEFMKIKEKLKESLDNYEKMNNDITGEFNKLYSENKELEDQLNEARETIGTLENENSCKDNIIAELEGLLYAKEIELKALEELEASYNALDAHSKSLKSQNELYESSIESLTNDNRQLASELHTTKDKTNSQIQSLNNKTLQQENLLKTNNQKIKQLEDELSNKNLQNSFLSKRLSASNTTLKLASQEMCNFKKELFEKQKKTESELEFISNYTLKSSQDHLEQERKLKRLAEMIEEKDSELGILREMIGELQRPKPSYFPVKDDIIDQALAEYINSKPEPLEVNFIREDQGTYLFGSKRVFIKIENGKIISKA